MSSSDSSIVRSAGEGGTEEGGLLIGRDKLVKLDEEPLSDDGGREACKEDRRANPPEDGGLEMDMHTESREGHSSSLWSFCCNMHMSGVVNPLTLTFSNAVIGIKVILRTALSGSDQSSPNLLN